MKGPVGHQAQQEMVRDSMASKKTLNAKNLEALGAGRLAELLIEISTGNAVAKTKIATKQIAIHPVFI